MSEEASRAPVRSMVVWCHDWPVQAIGARPTEATAVVFANRVVAATPAARAAGVHVGQRRREAQARCPHLTVHERDEGREARTFEAVLQAIEAFTPRLELTRPGVCTFATIGPSRYFGGDQALAARVRAAVDAVLAPTGWGGAVAIGVADGPFAAALAARLPERAARVMAEGRGAEGPVTSEGTVGAAGAAAGNAGTAAARIGTAIIPAGRTPAFLAPLPVAVLDRPELTDVLERLGLRTLADFGALDPPDVLARFGYEGCLAHRVAQGLDERPPDAVEPPPDLAVVADLDPPAERVDAAAFVAKALADELFAELGARGMTCTRVLIAAETAHGERCERLWRHEGALSAGAVTDRVRWQLDGWLHAPELPTPPPELGLPAMPSSRPTAGITVLRLVPDEVIPALGRQLGFWGGETEADRRALRSIARLQGLLGPEAVLVPEWRGGRGPAEQLVLVPAAAVELGTGASGEPGGRPASRRDWVRAPWPGQIPAPAPALVAPERIPADVVAADGHTVVVDGRGLPSAPPAEVAVDGGEGQAVAGWAGPWPAEERWWDHAAHRRRARLQVVTDDGTARLFVLEAGRWWLEAVYD
jgi:protein ImuB